MGQVQAKEAQGPGSDEIPLANIKAKVVNVSVDGIGRTKNDVIMDTVSDLFQVNLLSMTNVPELVLDSDPLFR